MWTVKFGEGLGDEQYGESGENPGLMMHIWGYSGETDGACVGRRKVKPWELGRYLKRGPFPGCGSEGR